MSDCGCCPSGSLLFGPGRTSPTVRLQVEEPTVLQAWGLGRDDCVKVVAIDEECGVVVRRTLCSCLVECRPRTLLSVPGVYELELSGDPAPPDPDAVFVRRTTVDVATAQVILAEKCTCEDVSYGMLAILQDETLFRQLLDAILADPVARCVLARALVSRDPFNSVEIRDCGLYENDGG